jgi:hypothetical protein
MKIDPDVRGVAANFGLDARLMQAVVQAEGNIVRAVQCSIPSVQTRDQALRVLARSIVHALSDYTLTNSREAFIAFFGKRWAPEGVANDPTNLNANWVSNVTKIFSAALVVLCLAMPAWAQDDCPPGHFHYPTVTALDDASMLAAYTASYRGLFGHDPSMKPGDGAADGWYWIHASNHYGVYGDDQCHAGWSGYWESWLQTGHGDLGLVQTPARFLPTIAPTPPVVVNSPVLPSVAVCDLSSITSEIANLRADVDAGRAENQQFYADARSKWEQVSKFIGKYGPIVAGAIFAGRASK